jgi:predicted phosphodiesterase
MLRCMLIRYLSDIHLEFIHPNKMRNLLYKIGKGPNEVCVLAGDIGNPFQSNYLEFMDHMNNNFKHTFVIPGNHEYYQKTKTMEEVNFHLKDFFQKYSNITYLNNSIHIYEGYSFIGSTLWSKITNPKHKINDVYNIPNFDYIKYNRLNNSCIDFLRYAVVNSNKKCVVITHHVPSYGLIDKKYLNEKIVPYNQWFYNDMDSFIGSNQDKISCWIYGHTHTSSNKIINKIPFLCNPIGYPNENLKIDFDKKFLL